MRYLPELCKILESENISDWNEEKKFDKDDNQEDIIIKEKLINYIKTKAKIIEDISEDIKLEK